MRTTSDRRRRAVGLVAAMAVTTVGCGPGAVDVAGTVSFQGRPVRVGSVALVGADGLPVVVPLDEGAFRATVPPGSVRVGVNSYDPGITLEALRERNELTPETEAELTAQQQKWFAIPEQYGDTRKSGLTFVAERSGQVVDFDLK